MLVLRRRDGEWVRIVHVESGEELMIRVYKIDPRDRSASLAFDDAAHRFQIERPGRVVRPAPRPDSAAG